MSVLVGAVAEGDEGTIVELFRFLVLRHRFCSHGEGDYLVVFVAHLGGGPVGRIVLQRLVGQSCLVPEPLAVARELVWAIGVAIVANM